MGDGLPALLLENQLRESDVEGEMVESLGESLLVALLAMLAELAQLRESTT